MSVEEAPRTVRQQIDDALAALAEQMHAQEIDLPTMLGEYRAVAGRRGWYLRPMRLRQQLRIAHLQTVVQDSTESALRGHVTIASLLLYRVETPDGDLTAWASRIADGSAFAPATEDDILDTFTLDDLNAEILRPMGFGWEDATTEPSAEGNAQAG